MPSLMPFLLAFQASLTGNQGGRFGAVILEAPASSDTAALAACAEAAAEGDGRFTVVTLPDSVRSLEMTGGFASETSALCSAFSLDVLLVLTVPEPVSADRATFAGDSLRTSTRTELTATGRFYSSTGILTGSVSGTAAGETPPGVPPDIDALACTAVARMMDTALMELFPAEVRFTAGAGPRIDLPAGSESGITEGMFVSLVAVSPTIPDDVAQYQYLRSHGIAQVTSSGPGASSALMLSGSLAPGGSVIALERGRPASLSIGWEMAPVSLEQGADTGEPFDDSGAMNRIRIAVSTLRWGLCLGGGLHAGAMDQLSSFGVDFEAGWRLPVSAPKLAARLSAGLLADFMIQNVALDTLASNATAATFGGYAECGLEYLASDRMGLAASVLGFAGTEADSWTVQEYGGDNREAEPSEIYYTSVERDPFSIRAGAFYLIF